MKWQVQSNRTDVKKKKNRLQFKENEDRLPQTAILANCDLVSCKNKNNQSEKSMYNNMQNNFEHWQKYFLYMLQ